MELSDKLGLRYGKVKLVPHSPEWKQHFQLEHKLLKKAIGHYVVEIRHIGSTAIPTIYAKPIIDIMAGLRQVEDVKHCIEPLKQIGYTYMGEQEIPGWHFFTKGNKSVKTHHLHVVEWKSEYWVTHILFQEYLCRHPEVAYAYEKLKLDLEQKYPDDRESYTRDKSDFIHAMTEMAQRARYHANEPEEPPLPPASIPPA